MAEVVAANAIARSAGAGSKAARILGVVLLLFVLATVVWGVVGVFFRDGLDAPPERPPPSSSVTQTVPPSAPALPAPVPSSSGATRG
jgi:hypothetical protein